jgi:spermidine/putrescine-binding protein
VSEFLRELSASHFSLPLPLCVLCVSAFNHSYSPKHDDPGKTPAAPICKESLPMTRWRVICGLLTLALVAGCKKESEVTPAANGAGETLNVYIWSEYLPQSVADRFTAKTGIKVVIDTYDSNETLQAKLQSGVADYDIVVPSDYMVRALIAEKLIQPIDRAKLPNFGNLDPQLLDQAYDPSNKHSVPYLWGLTGLAYNKTKVQETVDSWAVLFDEKYANQICMLDDTRECFGVALKLMGKSLNETDPKVLAQAAEMLKKQKPLVKAYDSADFSNKLASGDVWIAHGYTGQLAKAAHDDPEKRFVVIMPKEGGTVAVDNLCIPTSSKRVAAAHRFIDFILEAENAGEIGNSTFYASANQAARKLIKPEILNDPTIYPTSSVLKRCEFIQDVGETTEEYDRLWTAIKGG